jgi:ParE toxin of type II toxin-antitoxin system, parDE
VKVEFHPAADSELRAAASYYEDHLSGLGDEFLADVERACWRLSEHHALGPRLDADHRRLALRRFPFGLI